MKPIRTTFAACLTLAACLTTTACGTTTEPSAQDTTSSPTMLTPPPPPPFDEQKAKQEIEAQYRGYFAALVEMSRLDAPQQRQYTGLDYLATPGAREDSLSTMNDLRTLKAALSGEIESNITFIKVTEKEATFYNCANQSNYHVIDKTTGKVKKEYDQKIVEKKVFFTKSENGYWLIEKSEPAEGKACK